MKNDRQEKVLAGGPGPDEETQAAREVQQEAAASPEETPPSAGVPKAAKPQREKAQKEKPAKPERTPRTTAAPPPGTYPAPGDEAPAGAAAKAPPEPEPPAPVRRVGRITTALSLIGIGVLLMLHSFYPAMSYETVARFAPLVLVLLGLEILWASFFHREKRLKYDVFGIVLCILILCANVALSVVPAYFQRENEEMRLAGELHDQSYELLQRTGLPVVTVDWYVSLNGGSFTPGMDVMSLQPGQWTQVRVILMDEYGNEEEFAAAAWQVAQLMQRQVPHVDHFNVYTRGHHSSYDPERGDVYETYELTLRGRFQMGWSAAQMADSVETVDWRGEDWGYEMGPSHRGDDDPDGYDDPGSGADGTDNPDGGDGQSGGPDGSSDGYDDDGDGLPSSGGRAA